jgi:hypothetical protein
MVAVGGGEHARGLFLVWAIVWVVVVATMLTALWKSMRAQERMARTLEGIEKALGQRPTA